MIGVDSGSGAGELDGEGGIEDGTVGSGETGLAVGITDGKTVGVGVDWPGLRGLRLGSVGEGLPVSARVNRH
jgi:hypothetical protein